MKHSIDIRKIIFFSFIVPIVFISCDRKSASSSSEIKTIGLENIERIPRCSIHVEKEIFLETNVKGLISYPQKIIDHKGLLFVFSRMNNGTITIFNKVDGKFIRSISHVGKGPQEYTKIRDFTIDKNNDRILILDDNACVLEYSFNDVYISTIKLKITQNVEIRHIELSKNKILAEGMDKDFNSMLIFNKNGKLILAQLKESHKSAFLPYPLTFFGDSILFHKKDCDTIFCLKRESFQPYISLNFGHFKWIPELNNERSGPQRGDSKASYRMHVFFETTNFYYFDLNVINKEVSKSNYFHCFVRKKDNLPMCIEHMDLFKGILGHGAQFIGLSEDKKCLISYLLPVELHEYRDKVLAQYGQEKLNKEYPELVHLCQETRIDDNPVLLFINLKEE